MSGHSKWHNIQRRKGKQDAVRGQLFTKLSKDIYAAAREGGGNPDTNFRLKVAIERAKQNNLPSDTISRTVAKASGTLPGVTYEELIYEGYGPGGTAILLEAVTDNRNRTAADLRHLFSRRGGNLGETGCVAWMFNKVGSFTVEKSKAGMSADDLMLVALEAGAEDFKEADDHFAITSAPDKFVAVRNELERQGVLLEDAELTFEPQTLVTIDSEQADEVLDLIEALEGHDDVQTVYANIDVVGE